MNSRFFAGEESSESENASDEGISITNQNNKSIFFRSEATKGTKMGIFK
jgi:hypothetical protein